MVVSKVMFVVGGKAWMLTPEECPSRLRPRHRCPASASRADHRDPTPSSPGAAQEPALEQTDSNPPRRPFACPGLCPYLCFCPRIAAPALLQAFGFAPVPAADSHRNIEMSRPPKYEELHRKLDSSFLL